jgi:hypothetical protein
MERVVPEWVGRLFEGAAECWTILTPLGQRVGNEGDDPEVWELLQYPAPVFLEGTQEWVTPMDWDFDLASFLALLEDTVETEIMVNLYGIEVTGEFEGHTFFMNFLWEEPETQIDEDEGPEAPHPAVN